MSRGVYPNVNKQAGTGGGITSRSCDNFKRYLNYQSVYGPQIWQDGTLPSWAPLYKVISLLSECLEPPNLAGS